MPGSIWGLTGLTYEILITIEYYCKSSRETQIGMAWNFNCLKKEGLLGFHTWAKRFQLSFFINLVSQSWAITAYPLITVG